MYDEELEEPDEQEPKEFDPSAVESTLREAIGVTISELQEDLTEKLKDPLLGFTIHFGQKFKKAKRLFKEEYIRAVLKKNFGNISEAARILDLSRRTVHRLSEDEEVASIRKEMASPSYLAQQDISEAISDVLTGYSEVLHPKKLEQVYRKMPELSEDLVQVIEQKPLSLKDAVQEFERRYLRAAITRYGPNLTNVAKEIGIRYESLLRKVKELTLEV